MSGHQETARISAYGEHVNFIQKQESIEFKPSTLQTDEGRLEDIVSVIRALHRLARLNTGCEDV